MVGQMAVFLMNIFWHCYETTIALAQGHRSSGRAEWVKRVGEIGN